MASAVRYLSLFDDLTSIFRISFSAISLGCGPFGGRQWPDRRCPAVDGLGVSVVMRLVPYPPLVIQHVTIDAIDLSIDVAQPRGTLRDRVKHRLDISWRTGDTRKISLVAVCCSNAS